MPACVRVFVLCLYTCSSKFKHSLLTFDQPSSTVVDAHLQGKYTRCPPPPPPWGREKKVWLNLNQM